MPIYNIPISADDMMDNFPRGIILPWYSQSGPLPRGWVICDGNNGTPNLNGMFLMGVTNMAQVGQTGGGSVTVGPLSVSVASNGFNGNITNHPNGGPFVNQSWSPGKWHGLNSAGQTGTSTINNVRPPYTSVLFIMKT